jgi:glycerol-3-phosphate dehydrogenase subunit C
MRLDEFNLDNCLKCSVCNAACPVYSVHAQYPGPKHLGPELERLRHEGVATDNEWLEYCLGCHRCDLACPHQVGVSEMIAHAKASHRKPLVRGLRDWWFARAGLLGKLTTILPALSNLVLSLAPVRFLMSKLMQIAPQRSFPSYTRPNLKTPAIATSSEERPRVLFFPGCFIRYNRPELGRTILDLLERNGFVVEVAATECCGVPAMANGAISQARAVARDNVRILANRVEAGMRVVTACSSCGYMLKTGLGGLLKDDEQLARAAQRVGEQTFDLAELLMAQSDAGELNINFKPESLHLAYHAPCHQKAQGIGRPWLDLLRQIPGTTVDELDAGCCGMSGTYGFKQEKYGVSMAIGQELFDRIDAAQPEMVATECATCQMQIEHGTAFKAVHPAEILLQAYDGQSSR